MLTLGKPSDEHFRQEILELAEDLSRRAALALDNARLYSERMAISQSLQRSLLPPGLPDVPNVEIEVIYRAAGEGNEVGGDFYDVFPIRDGAYGFAIGDVCGTGPEAAAVTGLARHALRLLAREGFGGPAVLERLNAAILDEGARSRFLTLLYGELWPQEDGSALLKVVCAGHPLPLRLRQDGSVEAAAEPQPLLGVIEDLELYEQEVTLEPGRRTPVRDRRSHRTPRGHPHAGRRRPRRRPRHVYGPDGRRGGGSHPAGRRTLRRRARVRRHGHPGDAGTGAAASRPAECRTRQRKAPTTWRGPSCSTSPNTESNRRPSPYHGDALPTELLGPAALRQRDRSYTGSGDAQNHRFEVSTRV